ncbi:MAG: DUF554 domain-containing protein [Armatimonadetes bacterium]|nr:DUF554 domain-containing protein [Armatimonadota bacterium]
MARLPFPGTLLNTGTVVLGSALGIALGQALPQSLQSAALVGIGLVNSALGVKMFLGVKNLLLVAFAIALGGVLGTAIGIQNALVTVGNRLQSVLNAHGPFTAGFVGASVLFCIGPMTLLGCIQDSVEGKSDLLRLKSLLDGIASIFLAATLGVGVMASAIVVLIFQGGLTLAAKPLQPLAQDEALLGDTTAVGGLLILAIGFSLTDIKLIPTANYLPAIFLAPLGELVLRKVLPKQKIAPLSP